jgi:ribosome-binding factor A
MPREYPRSRRVGEQLQRELAELVRDELRDPRVKGVTITGVDCARDLSHAKVHFSLLLAEGEGDRVGAGKALNGAAGALHHELKRRLRMRSVPTLSFHYDDSLVRGARIEALIDRALAEDAQHLPGGSDPSREEE